MRKKLAVWGFDVVAHREMSSRMTPGGITGHDALIIFEEMTPNRQVVKSWEQEASRVGVPCIIIDRHESLWPKAFERQGYKTINPHAAAAVADNEETMAPPPVKVVPPPPGPTQQAGDAGTPQSFDDLATQLEVLISELKDRGLTRLTWSPEKGLDYEAQIVVKRHKSV